jgi:hypothetical protein
MPQWLALHVPQKSDESFSFKWGADEFSDLVDVGAQLTAAGALIAANAAKQALDVAEEGLSGAEKVADSAENVSFVFAIFSTWKMSYTALGEGYVGAKESWEFRGKVAGYGVAAAMGANSLDGRRAVAYGNLAYLKQEDNDFVPGTAHAYAEGYQNGFKVGYRDGRSLSSGQRAVFWKDLLHHASTLPGSNDYAHASSEWKSWSEQKKAEYYRFIGAVFAKFHIQGSF